MLPPKIEVSVHLGDTLVSSQIVAPGVYIIGTGPEAQIQFKADGVASRHARLGLQTGTCVVEDLGSVSGTFIDGNLLAGPHPLSAGQSLQIAGNTLRVRWLNEEELANLERSGVAGAARQGQGGGKYQIGRLVARGGMGIILDAYEVGTRRNVAMKIMSNHSRAGDAARFMREAQITAKLEHPNIVPVHEVGVDARKQPFYTMKLVRGTSLKDALEMLTLGDSVTSKRYPLSALLTIFQKICDAVAFAHSRKVMHRDLKPENIMLGEYGEVLLMDWGLAKAAEETGQTANGAGHLAGIPSHVADGGGVGAESSLAETVVSGPKGGPAAAPAPAALAESVDPVMAETIRIAQREALRPPGEALDSTLHGTVMGTPQYMSPEQARGDVEQLDERTDIYALGAILYQILALQAPFNGGTTDELLEKVCAGRFVSPTIAVGKKRLPHLPKGRVPESLAAVVMKAMALDPARRYQQVAGLQNEIAAYQNGFATSAEQASAMRLLALFLRRHRTLSGAAALLLLSCVIFTVKVIREKNRATEASVVAEAAKRRATEQRDVAEDRLYLSHMLQAGRNIRDGRPASARELLSLHEHEPSGRDLRDWEWYYSLGQLNQDRLRTAAHAAGVFSLAVSPDGSRLASVGGDGEIAVWQTTGLVPLFRLPAVTGAAYATAWDPTGHLLAAGGESGSVTVWDVDTRKKIAELHLPSSPVVRCLGWEPTGAEQQRLAIGGLFPSVVLWKPLEDPSGKKTEPLPIKPAEVAALCWSPDRRWLALGELASPGHDIELFNMEKRKSFPLAAGPGGDVCAVAIDPSSRYVAAGTKDRFVAVFEIESRNAVMREPMHRGFVSGVAWSSDGDQLVSASHDGTIQTYSPSERGKPDYVHDPSYPLQILSGHLQAVNAVAWARIPASTAGGIPEQAIFSGGADGTLRAWSPEAIRENVLDPPANQKNWVGAARYSPDGGHVGMTNFKNTVKVIDPDSRASFPLPAPQGFPHDLRWSPPGDLVAVAARGTGVVEVLDARSGKAIDLFSLDQAERVAWSSSGQYLASGGLGGVAVWDVHSHARLTFIPRPIGSLVWAEDERRLMLGGADGGIQVWDAFSGKELAEWREAERGAAKRVSSAHEPPYAVVDLVWNPAKKLLAFATEEGQAGLLDSESGRQVRVFTGHIGGIRQMAWSPDGRRLATVGQDGTLRIFNAQAGDQVAHIDHGTGSNEIHSVDWSPDGKKIITGGWDGHIRIWDESRGLQVAGNEQIAIREQTGAVLDAPGLVRLGDAYASLGWVDGTRNAFTQALLLQPNSPEVRAKADEAEATFRRALARPVPDGRKAALGHWPDSKTANLLNLICDNLDAGTQLTYQAAVEKDQAAVEKYQAAIEKYQAAIGAYRKLCTLPDAAPALPLAQRYFSRFRWDVTFFASTVDPEQDLAGWRKLVRPSKEVISTMLLTFPWHGQSPGMGVANPDGRAEALAADHCGMVARAKDVHLLAGKWRIQTEGDGGIRVLVNGKPVIEAWKQSETPVVHSGEFEQSAAETADITVEHFAVKPSAGLEVLFSPVIGEPAADGK